MRNFLLHPNKIAILFILFSTASFAVQDLFVKILSKSGSIWQLMFLRSLIVVILLLIWPFLTRNFKTIKPNKWWWAIIRAIFMSLAYTLFYGSLPFVSLSKAASCFFLAPILVCLLATIFLKEVIGIWRISAVIVGFLGVLMIVQPVTSNAQPILVLPILAASFFAFGIIITRGWCRDEPNFSLTIIHNIFYALLGLFIISFIPFSKLDLTLQQSNPFLFSGWLPLSELIIFLTFATAVTHIIGMTTSISAYKLSQVSLIAPFEYCYLVFCAIIDYYIFNIIPSWLVVLGISLIISSGVLLSIRENIAKKKSPS